VCYITHYAYSVYIDYADALYGTFPDRKEAYDYAISKMKKRIVEIQSGIDSYEYRKHGFCTTTINGETSVHEVDEYSWD